MFIQISVCLKLHFTQGTLSLGSLYRLLQIIVILFSPLIAKIGLTYQPCSHEEIQVDKKYTSMQFLSHIVK